jgi:hypothetical protein
MLHKFVKRSALVLLLGAAMLFLLPAAPAFSYPVPDLPEGNLIANPRFRSAADPMKPPAGWTSVDGRPHSVSRVDNPTPR